MDLTKSLNLEALDFLSTLQGNIIKGHGRSNSAFIVVKFNANFPNTTRAWVRYFAVNYVTSALEQYQAAKRRYQTSDEALFAMLLLSATGYEALGIPDDQWPDSKNDCFRQGMAKRGPVLSDPPKEKWEIPYQGDVDALVLLAHEDQEELTRVVKALTKQLNRFCDPVHVEWGKKLCHKDTKQVVEHFGHADGISQPLLIQQEASQELTAMAETRYRPEIELDAVLVKESGNEQTHDPTYGSFMVFRKLEQNVARYNELVTWAAKKYGVNEELASAYSVGRKKDGTPLTNQDPGASLNNFNFDTNTTCPVGTHIRKMNPRTDLEQVTDYNGPEDLLSPVKIVRRGIVYGDRNHPDMEPRTSGVSEPPEKDVGLLFISFQAELNSFEILQRRANDKDFIKAGAGVDRVIGQADNDSDLVALKGGGYFFAPSIPFLKQLGVKDLSLDQIVRFREAAQKMWESPEVFDRVSSGWKADRVAAISGLGVDAADFDDYYAYLVPFMLMLYPYTEDTFSVLVENRGFEPPPDGELPEETQEVLEAFLKLLEPARLEEFSRLWSSGQSEAALALVELSPAKNDAFYAFIKYKYQLDINMLIWL